MSERGARALLLLALLAFFWPVLFEGEVVFAHDNRLELGLPREAEPRHRSDRRFSDQSSVTIPELHHHLQGDSGAWLSTWNPHTELGRPSLQIASFGKAYFLTHLLSFLSDDALSVYTALAVAAVCGTVVFAHLWLRTRGLHPVAALVGALGLGLGVFAPWWLTFPMLLFGLCWTLGLLLALERFLRRPTAASALGIAFCVHALLLSGYPQQIVWHLFAVAALALPVWWRRRGPRRARALGAAAAVLAGLAAAGPVYLDLLLQAGRAARRAIGADFFLAALPASHGVAGVAVSLSQLFDAFWLGDPGRPDHPVPFDGVCATPPLLLLALLSLLDGLPRRLWPTQALVAGATLMTVWPPAYRLGVEYLGLGLSRFAPLAGVLIPLAALAAHAADHVLRDGLRQRAWAVGVAYATASAALLGAALSGHPLHPGFTAAGVAFALATLLFAFTRSAPLLVAVALAASLHYGFRLPLLRPREEIQLRSPLVEQLRRHTPGGARYALVGGDPGPLLPANQEALLGLRSIHSYNSLASAAFARFTARLGGGELTLGGRIFRALAPEGPLDPAALQRAGVGVLLALRPLAGAAVGERLPAPAPTLLYRTREPPLLQARLRAFERDGAEVRLAADPDPLAAGSVERRLDRDDELRFRLAPAAEPTLLFVSQQHHPQWRARAAGGALESVRVDGFYQGVLVPPGVREVELRFAPWARFAWLPQLLFAAAAATLLARARRREPGGQSPNEPLATRGEGPTLPLSKVRLGTVPPVRPRFAWG